MTEQVGSRGKLWFELLTGKNQAQSGDPGSVFSANAALDDSSALFLAVVPNPESRFPCVRDGQVGLEEAYTLAVHIRDAIDQDARKPPARKRPVIAVVDVKSQAYGRREETAGIFFAAAVAADAYASARMAGHPVISFVPGQAFSGGFLTHGYQANRILAFDDPGVVIHAMHKEAAARVTLRTVSELEKLGHEIIPMSYDVHDYAKLGLLYKLLHVNDAMHPTSNEVNSVMLALVEAIEDARKSPFDLSGRWRSDQAKQSRKAGLAARTLMEKQWNITGNDNGTGSR